MPFCTNRFFSVPYQKAKYSTHCQRISPLYLTVLRRTLHTVSQHTYCTVQHRNTVPSRTASHLTHRTISYNISPPQPYPIPPYLPYQNAPYHIASYTQILIAPYGEYRLYCSSRNISQRTAPTIPFPYVSYRFAPCRTNHSTVTKHPFTR